MNAFLRMVHVRDCRPDVSKHWPPAFHDVNSSVIRYLVTNIKNEQTWKMHTLSLPSEFVLLHDGRCVSVAIFALAITNYFCVFHFSFFFAPRHSRNSMS